MKKLLYLLPILLIIVLINNNNVFGFSSSDFSTQQYFTYFRANDLVNGVTFNMTNLKTDLDNWAGTTINGVVENFNSIASHYSRFIITYTPLYPNETTIYFCADNSNITWSGTGFTLQSISLVSLKYNVTNRTFFYPGSTTVNWSTMNSTAINSGWIDTRYIYSNKPILINNVFFFNTVSSPPVIPVYNSSVNINLPLDNFSDNSNIFSFSAYSKINLGDNFDVSKLTFKITYDNGLIPSDTNLYYKAITSNGFIQDNQYHFLNTFDLGVPNGIHTIRLTAFYDGVEVTYGEKTVNHLVGFVDSDGDTLDDRTGRTNANVGTSTNYNTLDPSQLNPLDPIGSATYIKNQATTFFDFINFLFSSFPAWITVPLSILFLCLILGLIFKILL